MHKERFGLQFITLRRLVIKLIIGTCEVLMCAGCFYLEPNNGPLLHQLLNLCFSDSITAFAGWYMIGQFPVLFVSKDLIF